MTAVQIIVLIVFLGAVGFVIFKAVTHKRTSTGGNTTVRGEPGEGKDSRGSRL